MSIRRGVNHSLNFHCRKKCLSLVADLALGSGHARPAASAVPDVLSAPRPGLLQLQWKGDVNEATKLISRSLELDDKGEFAYETLGTIEVQRSGAQACGGVLSAWLYTTRGRDTSV